MPLSRSISSPDGSLRQAAHHVQEPSTPLDFTPAVQISRI